jgi:transcriptional regulator with XRE-family HTH domain
MPVTNKGEHVTPLAVARALRVLGTHVSDWRKLQRLTAAQVAERAGISRDTLRAIEQGKGTASTENLLRVLRILGILDGVVAAADPYRTDVGRLRVDEILPKRVRG